MMILVMSLFSRSSVCFSVRLRMRQNVPQNIKNFLGEHAPRPHYSELQGGHVLYLTVGPPTWIKFVWPWSAPFLGIQWLLSKPK